MRFSWLTSIAVFCLVSHAQTSADPVAIFSEWDRQDSPGCAVGVTRDGKFEFARGFGQANLDYGLPITESSVFYIASTSKQFTAAAAATLVLRGKLGLDDRVRKFVPELPEYARDVQVKDLIHHTSGLRDFITLMNLSGERIENVHDDGDIFALLSRQKGLNFEAGTRWAYSNTGYWLLGVLVARVSGKPLRQFAQETLFHPLGMKDTTFHDDRSEIVRNRVTGYRKTPNGETRIVASLFDRVGDGGLLTTVEDLARWDANFYANRLEPGLTDLLLRRGRLRDGSPLDYAFGLYVTQELNRPAVRHGGFFGGFRAELLRFPGERLSVICLCNSEEIDPTAQARRVARLYLDTRPRRLPAVVDAKEGFTGAYRDLYSGAIYEFTDGPAVRIRGNPGSEVRLVATGKHALEAADPNSQLRVTWEDNRSVLWHLGAAPAVRLQRVELWDPAQVLGDFSGLYFSAELSTEFQIELNKGDLTLRDGLGTRSQLQPGSRDVFVARGLSLDFVRDANNRVWGFTLSANGGAVRGIEFIRK